MDPMVCNNQCLYQADAASTNQPQDKNLNLRQLKCQRCCMLEPPYILNLTNISFSLQVNYSLVKQLSTFFLYYPHRTQQEDRNHIISEKNNTTTSSLLLQSPTVLEISCQNFVCLFFCCKNSKLKNQIIGFNNTSLHI